MYKIEYPKSFQRFFDANSLMKNHERVYKDQLTKIFSSIKQGRIFEETNQNISYT